MNRKYRKLLNRLLTIQRKISEVDCDEFSDDANEKYESDIAQANSAIQNAIDAIEKLGGGE